MKITIVTAVHGRDYLWGYFNQSIRYTIDKFESLGYDVDRVAAVTSDKEQEYFYNAGWTTIQCSNEWLGTKWNNAIEYAWEDGCDYIFIIGSDDIVSDELIDLYHPLIQLDEPMFGIEKLYFLQLDRDVIKEFTGYTYKKQMALGAAKMISKKALSKVGGRPAKDLIKRGLDTSILVNLRQHGYNDYIVETNKFLILDMKTKDNLTRWEDLKGIEYTANYDKLESIFNIKIK